MLHAHVGLGVLARLLQAPGWPWGTGLAAAAHRGYWPCCYSPQDCLGLLVWLLQAPGWPEGYCPGCFRPQVGLGLLTCLLQPTGGACLAATALRIASGYWPGCYRPQVGLGVLAWLLQAPGWPEGYWPGCFRPKVFLRGTGLAATCRRLAWGTSVAAAAHSGYWP